MKLNRPFLVPDWVEWVGVGENGNANGFSHKPIIDHNHSAWVRSRIFSPGKCAWIFQISKPDDYTKELYQVIDGELVRAE